MKKDIFRRLWNGQILPPDDPDACQLREALNVSEASCSRSIRSWSLQHEIGTQMGLKESGKYFERLSHQGFDQPKKDERMDCNWSNPDDWQKKSCTDPRELNNPEIEKVKSVIQETYV